MSFVAGECQEENDDDADEDDEDVDDARQFLEHPYGLHGLFVSREL